MKAGGKQTLMMEAICSPVTSVDCQPTTLRYIPEHKTLLDELESIWENRVVVLIVYYPGICVRILRKTTRNLN
jgi:hypothetical protein